MRLDQLPNPSRLALFAVPVGLTLYLSISPTDAIPSFSLWDKAQHALAFAALTALGLLLWPRQWRAVAGFCLALGLVIEILQAQMDVGRFGDWRDMVADAVGVLVALRLVQAGRWLSRRR